MNIPRAGALEELSGGGEDDDGDLGIAENGKLLGFLEKPSSSFGESHLPGSRVVDLPYLDLLSRHSQSLSPFPP